MGTENVAILFTDVVGSTELASRLSPEAADEVRRAHFSILRQAIAEAGGTEVKNLGDGIMVVFGSASAALSCAVTMQQGVERDNRGDENPVYLRVGLSGGEVSREDDDYFGDPVIEAARLCARCEGGQILAADVVRAMAGRRSRHQCHSVGPLTLKGLPEPVESVEVIWTALGSASSALPMPLRLTVRPGVGVVGRGPELETIADAAKRVATGNGREVLLVSGEAGLGKTTLVAEAARAVFDAGACVILGHCEEELATPYQLFAEALTHYVTHADEDTLRAHVDAHGSELARLVPALGRRLPNLPPSKATDTDTERYLLFAAVVGLLALASEQQPVVLVLDDLQWADSGSLQLLRHLAATDQQTSLLVIGTYRDTELSRSHPLIETLGALRRLQGVARIELKGLDDRGVVSFLQAAAGHTLDEAGVGLAHAVYRETDGNPFFVSEVLRHLSETGAIYQDATGRWVSESTLDDVALPDSVREVIGARVVRLGAGAEHVLSMAAVIGRDFDLEILAPVSETSEDELLDVLDTAAAAALVRESPDAPGRYTFAHALIQHTLYEDLGPTRRARAHRRIAEALEDLCGGTPGARVGELARHWFSATRQRDLTKALDYSRQAADAALAALAPGDALRYYTQALDLCAEAGSSDPALEIDLGIGIGTAQRQTGDPAYRETLLGAARRAIELGDTARLVAAALANDRGIFSALGTVDPDKVEVLETALARLPAHNRDRALVLANLCKERAFGSPLELQHALADEAIAIARALADDATIVRVLNHVTIPLLVPNLREQAVRQSEEALALAERVGDPVLLAFAAAWRHVSATSVGDIAEADRSAELVGALSEQLDQPTLHWVHSVLCVTRTLIAGDTDRAEQLATEALQIGTDGEEADAAAFFGAQLMSVSFQRGTMGDLDSLIQENAAAYPEVPTFVAALAMAHVEADRTGDARQLLEQFAATGFELPLDGGWITGMTCYAEAAIECGDPSFAGPLLERLSPWADQVSYNTLTTEGPISHFIGGLATVVGRYDEADAHFRQSADFCNRVAAKFFAARTDLLWARMLTGRNAPGDIEHARELLANAQRVAATNGYANVERRATRALQSLP